MNVKSLNVDMLSASAHKFNGPKGIGFIYIRRGMNIESLILGGGQENGMRSGTENVASIAAMAVALKENVDSMQNSMAHLRHLSEVIAQKLALSGLDFRINGGNDRLPGLLSLSFRDVSGESILHQMDLHGISISTGSACHAHDAELSHVIQAIAVPEEYAHGTVRISLGSENTVEDAEIIAKTLIQCVNCIMDGL